MLSRCWLGSRIPGQTRFLQRPTVAQFWPLGRLSIRAGMGMREAVDYGQEQGLAHFEWLGRSIFADIKTV
jgi:hypothetical protein